MSTRTPSEERKRLEDLGQKLWNLRQSLDTLFSHLTNDTPAKRTGTPTDLYEYEVYRKQLDIAFGHYSHAALLSFLDLAKDSESGEPLSALKPQLQKQRIFKSPERKLVLMRAMWEENSPHELSLQEAGAGDIQESIERCYGRCFLDADGLGDSREGFGGFGDGNPGRGRIRNWGISHGIGSHEANPGVPSPITEDQ